MARVFTRDERNISTRGIQWALWGKWTLANGLAEAVGLGATLVAGIAVFAGLEPRIGAVATGVIGVATGALVEGGVVGTAQWLILRGPLDGLPWRRWAAATAIGAGIAWALGMAPSVIIAMVSPAQGGSEAAGFPEGLPLYALTAGLGFVTGPILAVAQWWVLRDYLPAAGWWILATACAWAIGMPLIYWGISLIPAGGINAAAAATLAGCALLAGTVVGAIHGLALVLLVRERDRQRTA